jgi:hypothetical protein
MNQIPLDDTALASLDNATGPTEIVDSHGQVHGVCTPSLSNCDPNRFDLKDAERIRNDPNHRWITTAELLKNLESGRRTA